MRRVYVCTSRTMYIYRVNMTRVFFLPISACSIKPSIFIYFFYSSPFDLPSLWDFFLCSQFIAGHHSPGRRRYIHRRRLIYIYIENTHMHTRYIYICASLRQNQSFTISLHRQFSTKSIGIMCAVRVARRTENRHGVMVEKNEGEGKK